MNLINESRFFATMQEQAHIGATEDGGLSRPALSEADVKVRQWFKDKTLQAGLEYSQDGAGNISALLRSDDASAKTLLIGSHLDSVVHGGRFDGALGVLSAFEVLRTIKDTELSLPFHLECISFTDEESRHIGLLGSSALSGNITTEAFLNLRSSQTELAEGMARIGITQESIINAKRDPSTLLGYLEVHIEQGTRLESSGIDIGIVTAIVGIRGMWLTFKGEAAHAGTQAILDRKDAMLGASHFTIAARQLVLDQYLPGVVNVGHIELKPGAFNIVPAEVTLAVEFRHGDADILEAMKLDLETIARNTAEKLGLEVEVAHIENASPAPMSDTMMKYLENACDTVGCSHTRLMSFAGHDSQNMAPITDSAMFFVPSQDGISHNPMEYTTPEDCVNAANVMLQTVLNIAGLK